MAIMVLDILLAAGLGAVFAVSGVAKMRAGTRFVITVVDFRIVPLHTGVLFARLLPSIEVFGALVVASGAAVRFGALMLASLSLIFIYAISLNLARKRTLTCGCFGGARNRILGRDTVLQDVVLLGASTLLIVLCSRWVGIEPWSPFRSVTWAARSAWMAPLSCAAITVCVWWITSQFPLWKRRRSHFRGAGIEKEGQIDWFMGR